MSTFTWRFEAADGTLLPPGEDPGTFPSRADAETWVGESWRSLLGQGVEQVSLLQDDEVVYPMSLRPLEQLSPSNSAGSARAALRCVRRRLRRVPLDDVAKDLVDPGEQLRRDGDPGGLHVLRDLFGP